MQQLQVTKLITFFLTSVLLVACGDKSTEQQSSQETEKVATPANSQVADLNVPAGKALHDANCISCHDAKVYTRVERKVLDYTQLAAQVKRCDANLGSRLFDEDLAQITDYLNQTYYKYPKQ